MPKRFLHSQNTSVSAEHNSLDVLLNIQNKVLACLAEPISLKEMITKLLSLICKDLNWDVGEFWVPDQNQENLNCLTTWTAAKGKFKQQPYEIILSNLTNLPTIVWREDKTICIENISNSDYRQHLLAAWRAGLQTACFFPVKFNDTLLGVINFYNGELKQITEFDKKIIHMLGNQVGAFMLRKQFDQERDKLSHYCKLLLETTTEGIFGIDLNGDIILVNKATARILGYTQEELVGQHGHLLIHHHRPDGTVYPKDECPIYRAFLTGEGSHRDDEVFWRRDNTPFPVEYTSFPIIVDGQIKGAVVTFNDITQRKQLEQQLQRLAHYDALTGLANRITLVEQATKTLAHGKRYQQKVAVLFLDLDRFKFINDNEGHAAGDVLLQIVAERFKNCVRTVDTIARLGGDEFVIVLAGVAQQKDVLTVVKKIKESLLEPIKLNNKTLVVTTSIGISMYSTDGSNIEELLHKADVAMYQAKKSGENCCCFYKGELYYPEDLLLMNTRTK